MFVPWISVSHVYVTCSYLCCFPTSCVCRLACVLVCVCVCVSVCECVRHMAIRIYMGMSRIISCLTHTLLSFPHVPTFIWTHTHTYTHTHTHTQSHAHTVEIVVNPHSRSAYLQRESVAHLPWRADSDWHVWSQPICVLSEWVNGSNFFLAHQVLAEKIYISFSSVPSAQRATQVVLLSVASCRLPK